MPSLAERAESTNVKIMLIGDSGTGKTGALTSLVKAGYKLRIIDLDSGLDSLVAHVRHECPDKLINVDYETVRDKYKWGEKRDGERKYKSPVYEKAIAFQHSLELMEKWSDGTSPETWGNDHILVLDSLTALGKAAYNWAHSINPGAKDKRQTYKTAQDAVEDALALLTDEAFATNVIVISHVNYMQSDDDAPTYGYPSAIGSALSPKIAKYFNTLVLARSVGVGDKMKRKIRTVSSNNIELKNPVSFGLDVELELGTGLAEIFAQIKGTKK